jgi:hypothetical protein
MLRRRHEQLTSTTATTVAPAFVLGPYLANHSVLPAWLTSNNFNFPLDTATIAVLYIGFHVGASTNRTERHNRNPADRMEDLEKLIQEELRRTTEITDEAHAIAELVRAQVPLLERTNAHIARPLLLVAPVQVAESSCPRSDRAGGSA